MRAKNANKPKCKASTSHYKFLLSTLLLFLFLLSSCGSECYDVRDYKASFAEKQSSGIRLCASKDMQHLSTNLVSLNDEWLITCYTKSPVRTYGFNIQGE